ncbi:MAG: LysR substrate-binding domain-containing protein [Myxococcales bacterium]
MRDLPIELLRTFVAVVETGTMAKAARVVARTPSAVSLQMSKLTEIAGHPLFRNDGRGQRLTDAGETLLRHAREILDVHDKAVRALADDAMEGPVRFGTVQDLADTLLPGALARFAATHPGVTLDVHVGTSALLLDEAAAGELDFVVCFESRRAPRVIRREPLVWLGRRTTSRLDPLPIAILQPACALCDEGIAALQRAGRSHHVVLRTPSLSGLRAALEAGLAVGARTPLLRSGNIELLGADDGLPPLPDVAFALHVPRALSPAARRVASLVRGVIAQAEASDGRPAPPLMIVGS